MTLLQAMERTDWSLRLDMVVTRTILIGQKHYACEVCGNELGFMHFAVVRDDYHSYHIDVGPRCASDLETAIQKERPRK